MEDRGYRYLEYKLLQNIDIFGGMELFWDFEEEN